MNNGFVPNWGCGFPVPVLRLYQYSHPNRIGDNSMGRQKIERLTITCPVCGDTFTARASRKRRYCSRECSGKAAATRYVDARVPVQCLACGSGFAVRPARQATAKYCCFACKQGHVARSTIEGRADAMRYRGKGVSYVKYRGRHLHRVLMERILGRPLVKGEVVHHRDGNHRNNDPENLVLLSGQGQHARLHNTKPPPG